MWQTEVMLGKNQLHMVQTRLKNDIAMEAHPSHKETSSENNISHEDQHLLTQVDITLHIVNAWLD